MRVRQRTAIAAGTLERQVESRPLWGRGGGLLEDLDLVILLEKKKKKKKKRRRRTGRTGRTPVFVPPSVLCVMSAGGRGVGSSGTGLITHEDPMDTDEIDVVDESLAAEQDVDSYAWEGVRQRMIILPTTTTL